MGDLLLLCNSKLIQKNVKKGKKLLKSFSQIEHQRGLITCYHLQHLLAVYFQDCCDDKDIEAYEMFQLAADQGHAMSISTLGYFNDYGTKVVQKNPEKSFALYLQAANKGYPIAQSNVGKCYDTGQGVEKNQVLAAEWFHKSAEQGHVDALYNLGVFYQQGLGVELNFSEGYRYYKLAAIQGDAAAQYNTGWCYHQGIGVERDEESALYWMFQSAEQGDESAPLYLGLAYRHGWGVKANIVESVRYFKRTLKVSPNNEYSSNQVIKLMGEYKNAVRLCKDTLLTQS
jgi:TPR repeat protein